MVLACINYCFECRLCNNVADIVDANSFGKAMVEQYRHEFYSTNMSLKHQTHG